VGAINYELPDDLHMRAKAAAAMHGMTLKAFIVAAIEEKLADEPPTPKRATSRKKG